MTRPLRIPVAGGAYHVYARGNAKQAIFLDDRDHRVFLDVVVEVLSDFSWQCLAYCLMPNHYHLIVQLNDDGLSDGMRELNGCFSRWSNLRAGRTGTGHLWQNRFKSAGVVADGHLWEVFRYVPNNPVVGGLVGRPEEWPWTGYRATIGIELPYSFHQPGELLRYFGQTPDAAVARYRRFVFEGRVRSGHAKWSDQDAELAAPPSTVVESGS
jgi:putative transposase